LQASRYILHSFDA